MKYLIGEENCKVIMKGRAVVESKLSNDFVYDTKGEGISIASMKEIAKVNGFKVKGKKTEDVKNSFDAELKKLDLPEKREMSQTEKVIQIVKEGHEEGKSEDDILISIVQSGVKFQSAAKMMKQALIDLGLSISAKDRYTKAKVLMEDDDFAPEEYDEVSKMAKKITKEIPNTSEKLALGAIRKFCKELEIDLPKKPKEAVVPFGIQAIAWMCQNQNATVAEMEDWMEELGKGENVIKRQTNVFEKVQVELKKAADADDDSDESEED